jgi:predicted RNase H-like nuclease
MSKTVLGIDAAWTEHHPSGVALVRVPARGRPRLLRVARSYEEFCDMEGKKGIDWQARVRGASPNIPALLGACEKTARQMPSVIACDIPLGALPINGRRTADKTVTQLYVSRRAGTHSPTAQRPGPISHTLFEQLTACGLQWLHAESSPFVQQHTSAFFETYPHPAIIELLGLDERLKYKVSKRKKYWPDLDSRASWIAIARELDRLRANLDKCISGVAKWMPPAKSLISQGRLSKMKGYEDAMDAIVCAWIACEFLAGRCVAYGDADSAIWLPRPRTTRIKNPRGQKTNTTTATLPARPNKDRLFNRE